MPESHEVEVDMLGLVREEQRRWWRLAFLSEEVTFAERHLATEVADARDAGWSWRRLGAATGIPAETLRLRSSKPCDLPPLAGGGEPAPSTEGRGSRPARLR